MAPNHPEAWHLRAFREKFPDNLHHGHIAIELSKVAPDMPCLEFSGKSNAFAREKINVAAPQNLTEMTPQQWPTGPDGDTEMTNFIQHTTSSTRQEHLKHTLRHCRKTSCRNHSHRSTCPCFCTRQQKDPNRIPFAQVQKGLCDGEAACLICAGTSPCCGNRLQMFFPSWYDRHALTSSRTE